MLLPHNPVLRNEVVKRVGAIPKIKDLKSRVYTARWSHQPSWAESILPRKLQSASRDADWSRRNLWSWGIKKERSITCYAIRKCWWISPWDAPSLRIECLVYRPKTAMVDATDMPMLSRIYWIWYEDHKINKETSNRQMWENGQSH